MARSIDIAVRRSVVPVMSATFAALLLLFLVQAFAAESITLPARAFRRHNLLDPSSAQQIREAQDLKASQSHPSGWVEYDFQVPKTGWYELGFLGWGGGDVEFMIDAKNDTLGPSGTYFLGLSMTAPRRQAVGNAWLTAGAHRVRVQRLHWTGFPPISAIELKPTVNTFAAIQTNDQRVFRKDHCGNINLVGGGAGVAVSYQIFELDSVTGLTRSIRKTTFPATRQPATKRLAVPCSKDGFYTLAFGANDRIMPGLGKFSYEVVDTTPQDSEPESPDELILKIDCSKQAPNFSGSDTHVVQRPFGAYREAGDRGWTKYQRYPREIISQFAEPGWFAYTLNDLVPQTRHRIEIDYPDDARRTFAIALREASPLRYPVAVGVTSGGEYTVSESVATQAMVVWPRTNAPRLLFVTAHDGDSAACSQVRVYRTGTPKAIVPVTRGDHRQIVHWYEEGSNFESLFSPPDVEPAAKRIAAGRWFETARANGVNLLMPTVAVYGSALFPTRREITEFRPQVDDLRRMVLLAEKYGIKLAAEIHPRGDELSWGYARGATPPDNLLVSREGKTNFFAGDGKTRNFPPHYDPLDPRVQSWYLSLIGEIADRYKDSPAFDGVSLRYMPWANGSFNNFVSLDWGYSDRTIALFRQETGQPLPQGTAGDPNRFAERYKWLTTVGRKAWINWRCRKIADLLAHALERMRQARPDLKLYLHVFNTNGNVPDPPFALGSNGAAFDRLKESGIDPLFLRSVSGLVLVDSPYAYGRHSPDNVYLGNHDHLLEPASLSVLSDGGPGRFILGMHYLEATDVVVPPQRIGFPASTKATWMSVPANPASRHALERYAIPLAVTDALMLGDGGNGYTFGPRVVRQFLSEYAQLPDQPFVDRGDAIDPVTIRTLATDDGLMFYAVNRERYPVETTILLNKPGKAIRLSTGQTLPSAGRSLTLELDPYELIVGRLDPGLEIASVASKAPPAEIGLVEDRLKWLQRLAASKQPTSSAEKITLGTAIGAAADALKKGRLWRARTALEHNSLLAIYRRLDCYPPRLFATRPAQDDCDPDARVTKP